MWSLVSCQQGHWAVMHNITLLYSKSTQMSTFKEPGYKELLEIMN